MKVIGFQEFTHLLIFDLKQLKHFYHHFLRHSPWSKPTNKKGFENILKQGFVGGFIYFSRYRYFLYQNLMKIKYSKMKTISYFKVKLICGHVTFFCAYSRLGVKRIQCPIEKREAWLNPEKDKEESKKWVTVNLIRHCVYILNILHS